MDARPVKGQNLGFGRAQQDGEWDATMNCAPARAIRTIWSSSASCRWGERAASGSSIK